MLRTAHPVVVPADWPTPAVGRRIRSRPLADHRPVTDRVLAVAERYRWVLFAVAAAAYAAAFNGQWRVQPDAALYLSIGRNLADGRGFTYLGQPNHLAYPGWPLLIAGCFRLFGTASLVPIHLLLLLIAAATLAAVYRLVLLHAGRPTAVVVTVGTALTKSFFVYALELWSDLPFALAAVSVLAGYEAVVTRRSRAVDWALLAGGMGLAMVMRVTAWPLLAAVAVAAAIDARRGRLRWRTLAAVVGVGVTLLATCLLLDPRRHDGTSTALAGQYGQYLVNRLHGMVGTADRPLPLLLHDLFSYAASDVLFQTRFGDAANGVLGTVVLALGFGLYRCRPLWGLWFTLLLATVLMGQQVLDRYFLPVLPLLVYAWWSALAWADRRWARGAWRWPVEGLVLLALGFGAVANVAKVGGLIGQQRSHAFLVTFNRGWAAPLPGLAAAIHRRVGADGLVLVKPPYGRAMSFLSGRDVATGLEAPPLLARHRPVFVVEPADARVRSVLAAAGLVEGPALYTAPPPPPGAAKAEQLSLHQARPR